MIQYPPQLPVSAEKDRIISTLRQNRVIVISGSTGSGKTTQIPKMCLEAFPKMDKRILCTQPRRIAAISVAQRIAEEMEEPFPSGLVGYKIRFDEKVSPNCRIKLVTDGILLAETQRDPLLREYGAIIIDEAHERSLNIDFLLGILRGLLRKRRDLKLIITSATIDTKKFSEAFDQAPIIEVSGKLFPVEVRYRPPEDPEEPLPDQAVRICSDLVSSESREGDILVFMPTEQDIRETCRLLTAPLAPYKTEILPLFARLSAADQHRIFEKSTHRRIIVSTNIAETSLTIPHIRYVVDSGLARISDYSPASRTSSLPIRPVSRSSADQRKGRCGRLENGICVRLYSEEDYDSRPLYTAPEVLRTNLAEVILRMLSLKIRDVESFPFIDPPKSRAITDGFRLLEEVGSLYRKKGEPHITAEGKIMAALPLDPRLSRIVLTARKENVLREIVIIIAALSIPPLTERPADAQDAADKAHKAFWHKDSDFLTYLNLWHVLHDRQKELSKSKFRKFCRENYLSHRRFREWLDVHRQILRDLKEHELRLDQHRELHKVDQIDVESPLYGAIHRSILSGFLSNIAVKEDKHLYRATKSRQMMLHPGSALFGCGQPWVVCAEMVETSRLFGRSAAAVTVDMIREAGGDRVKITRYNPYWDMDRERAVFLRKASVFGLPLGELSPEPMGLTDPEGASELFIRKALIEQEIPGHSKIRRLEFYKKNNALIRRIEKIEHRLRTRGILETEETLFSFYKERLEGVWSTTGLIKRIHKKNPDLMMSRDFLLQKTPEQDLLKQFPEYMVGGDKPLKLTYRFNPGDRKDGITLNLKQEEIHRVDKEHLEWLVPGLLPDKIEHLLRNLPRDKRRLLSPIGATAAQLASELTWREGSFPQQLSRLLQREYRMQIPPTHWREIPLPEHLMFRIEVRDAQGKVVSGGRGDQSLSASVEKKSGGKTGLETWQKSLVDQWEWEEIPETVKNQAGTTFFPALCVHEGRSGLKLYNTPIEAEENHRRGLVYLLFTTMKQQIRALGTDFHISAEHSSTLVHFGGQEALQEAVWKGLIASQAIPAIRSRLEWTSVLEELKEALPRDAEDSFQTVDRVLDAYRRVAEGMIKAEYKALTKGEKTFVKARRKDLNHLVPPDFPEKYSEEQLHLLPRYIRALGLRTDKGCQNLARDRELEQQVLPLYERLQSLKDGIDSLTSWEKRKKIREIEEEMPAFRSVYFAPEVKIPGKHSETRLTRAFEAAEQLL